MIIYSFTAIAQSAPRRIILGIEILEIGYVILSGKIMNFSKICF